MDSIFHNNVMELLWNRKGGRMVRLHVWEGKLDMLLIYRITDDQQKYICPLDIKFTTKYTESKFFFRQVTYEFGVSEHLHFEHVDYVTFHIYDQKLVNSHSYVLTTI